jgi:cytochrome c peroxidase
MCILATGSTHGINRIYKPLQVVAAATWLVVVAVVSSGAVTAAGEGAKPDGGVERHAALSAAPPAADAAAMARLGRLIFNDAGLSASGRLACSSCHDPAHAYAPSNDLAVQRGGPHLNDQGMRAAPSLRYVLNRTPRWNKTFVSDPLEQLVEANEPPSGGFGWDGRFASLRAQAEFPLLAANEMANSGPKEIADALKHAPYAGEFKRVFGADALDDPRQAYSHALDAIERFELDDRSFHPYTSKYDDYLDGKAALTGSEKHGLVLFEDPKGGNCAQCHLDQAGMDGSHPLFTDYQYESLGVPRNTDIGANRDARFFDLGLCGPLRLDQAQQKAYCGLFKTPTLRNVATRGAFFHNGRFHTLREALEFYVARDTDSGRWYPTSSAGSVEAFDDLPSDLRSNVDHVDSPLDRAPGAQPVWSPSDIDDVIAFLNTLTDDDVAAIH